MILFVVNETSGNGRSRSISKRLEARLVLQGVAYERVSTSSAEQARGLVRERIERGGLIAVAVVGGDGTLHGLLPALAGSGVPLVTATVDGKTRRFERCWLSAVTNVPTYGLRISPSAQPDDGLIHLCVVHACSVLRFLMIFPTVLFGQHVRWTQYVTLLTGSEAAIEASPPMLAFGDGEPAGQTPLRTAIRPGQLDFLMSASG